MYRTSLVENLQKQSLRSPKGRGNFLYYRRLWGICRKVSLTELAGLTEKIPCRVGLGPPNKARDILEGGASPTLQIGSEFQSNPQAKTVYGV